MKILDKIINSITYKEPHSYSFSLAEPEKVSEEKMPEVNSVPEQDEKKKVFPSIDVNLEYVKKIYNFEINSDIKLREFYINAKGKQYSAFLLYIDGMINSESINKFVIEPLMIKNDSNETPQSPDIVTTAVTNNVSVRRVKKFDLKTYILEYLIPQNDVDTEEKFKSIFQKVNAGISALFIDTLNVAFVIDAKGFEKRSIAAPENEVSIRGSQEGFVESIRTNTSLLRRIVNNEDFIIENANVRKN